MTAYAAQFAVQEAAKIAAAEDISAQLDALIAIGESEVEIDAIIGANPPELPLQSTTGMPGPGGIVARIFSWPRQVKMPVSG